MRKSAQKPHFVIYAADFETTLEKDTSTQKQTEVWSSAFCPVRKVSQITGKRPLLPACEGDVIVHHSIGESLAWLEEFHEDITLYYHNLKFDGSFWLDYLMRHGWKYYKKQSKKDEPPARTFDCLISDLGQWYSVTLFFGDHSVEMRDSLKLLPMSLRTLGKSFKTKHQKLDMEYTGHRFAGCEISPEEMHYIKNDVLVLAEALEIMFAKGHDRLTIGACCLQEYKKSMPKMAYEELYKRMDLIELPAEYGAGNADAYIRKAYKGGWCYAMKGRTRKIIKNGCTADVNSLYPSVMSSESGSIYPVGIPHFWRGPIPEEAKAPNRYYFIRFQCAFSIKDGFLPFVQIKGSMYYNPVEMLEDSRPRINGRKYRTLFDSASGEEVNNRVELTMTCTDFELFKKHYNIYHLVILDGCWFYAEAGIFDDYIYKYRKIKEESTDPATRKISKLLMNNLYGKLSSSTDSSYRVPVFNEDDVMIFKEVEEYQKKPLYIPAGAAITSYARNFTITAAQKNYKYFCYADTDSIHCNCRPDQLQGVPVDPVKFCHWKIETTWDAAYFVRQKTYIEHVTKENEKPVDEPYYNVKCAGMPDNCKQLFIESLTETEAEAHAHALMYDTYINYLKAQTPRDALEREKFLSTKRSISDFDRGLVIYGKLMPKHIKGGLILESTFFEMR